MCSYTDTIDCLSTEGGQRDRRFDVFQSALEIDKYLALEAPLGK